MSGSYTLSPFSSPHPGRGFTWLLKEGMAAGASAVALESAPDRRISSSSRQPTRAMVSNRYASSSRSGGTSTCSTGGVSNYPCSHVRATC